MKRTVLILLVLFLIFSFFGAFSQVMKEETKKKISIGVGLHTDIFLDLPEDIKTRAINQGVDLFATYNVPFGKSDFGFSIGLGLSSHNMFGNFLMNSTADSTMLQKIPDTIDYNRSKITMAYLDLPVEFRFKSKSKISVVLGFKASLMIGSNTKYVGEGNISGTYYDIHTDDKIRLRFWGLKNVEQFTYGPTFRIGYKWITLNAYYMLNTMFNSRGPQMHPISVGFLIVPF